MMRFQTFRTKLRTCGRNLRRAGRGRRNYIRHRILEGGGGGAGDEAEDVLYMETKMKMKMEVKIKTKEAWLKVLFVLSCCLVPRYLGKVTS
jgi:hypothetical protein